MQTGRRTDGHVSLAVVGSKALLVHERFTQFRGDDTPRQNGTDVVPLNGMRRWQVHRALTHAEGLKSIR